jgi:hypothetical protein
VTAPFVVAAGPHQTAAPPPPSVEGAPPPEELMRRRFPQPIKVAALIGLPVLDWNDSTIGYIREVVRNPEGRIALVVPYSAWLGWASFAPGKRAVVVPIEKVAILGRQVGALEMSREDFDKAPTWSPVSATPISPEETIRIAITRR